MHSALPRYTNQSVFPATCSKNGSHAPRFWFLHDKAHVKVKNVTTTATTESIGWEDASSHNRRISRLSLTPTQLPAASFSPENNHITTQTDDLSNNHTQLPMFYSLMGHSVHYTDIVTVSRNHPLWDPWAVEYANSAFSGQLSLLASAGRKMSTSQSAVTLCGWE